MTASKTVDVSHLPPYDISNQAPLWWGQLLLAAIEGMMFCILIAAFFYVRLRVDVWPPPGDQYPHKLLPSLALIPLLVSCLGTYWASEAAKKDDRAGMIKGLLFNLVLGVVFFVMRVMEWHSLNFTYKADIFGTYMWTFLAVHTYDYVADIIFTAMLFLILLLGRHGPKMRLGVHVDSVVWYFLVIIWIPIYVVVYWGPQFMETQ
ncbi:MAG: cytochrome c oxidase subunit 3 [Bryobacteraceae bacterium]